MLRSQISLENIIKKRCFIKINSFVYNKHLASNDIMSFRYDRKRVQEIGPDRACAEWLLRCGGSVRFKNWGSFVSNYNTIPIGPIGQFKIEEIRAINACITSEGFAYVDGLTDLKKIHLEKCDQVGDSMFWSLYIHILFLLIFFCLHIGAIARCNKVKDTLESITLIDLVQISENGLAYLAGLKYIKYQIIIYNYKFFFFRNLKQVDLTHLSGIKDPEAVIKLLKAELPHCVINYNKSELKME